MALFTRENAREMSRRANLKRWSRPKPEERKSESPAAIPGAFPEIVEPFASQTRAQIDKIDSLISTCRNAERLDLLTRSKERLWKIYSHAANIPLPGARKPAKPKPGQISIDISPAFTLPAVADAVEPEPKGISCPADPSPPSHPPTPSLARPPVLLDPTCINPASTESSTVKPAFGESSAPVGEPDPRELEHQPVVEEGAGGEELRSLFRSLGRR